MGGVGIKSDILEVAHWEIRYIVQYKNAFTESFIGRAIDE